MTNVKCPGCGATIDSLEKPCPTCGLKKDPAFRRKLLQFIALFAILGALWLYFLLTNTAAKKPGPTMPGEREPAVQAP